MIEKNFIPDRQPDETVITHLWPHPLVFIKLIILIAVLLLFPLAVYAFLYYTLPIALSGAVITPILTVIGSIYMLMILLLALFFWMDNYLDVITITNYRIIHREQNGLFNRVTSELELYRVQDVTVSQKGFLQSIFNYGSLQVQTAGEQEHFEFLNIPHPTQTARQIQELDRQAKEKYFVRNEELENP